MVKQTYFCDVCGKQVEDKFCLFPIKYSVQPCDFACSKVAMEEVCQECLGAFNKAIDAVVKERSGGKYIVNRD